MNAVTGYAAPPDDMPLTGATGVYRRYAAGVRSLLDRAAFDVAATVVATGCDCRSYPGQAYRPAEALVVLDIGDDIETVLDPDTYVGDATRKVHAEIPVVVAVTGGGRMTATRACSATTRWIPTEMIPDPVIFVRSRDKVEASRFDLRPGDADALLDRALNTLVAQWMLDLPASSPKE